MTVQLTTKQKAALFDRMLEEGGVEPQYLIADMSTSLADAVRKKSKHTFTSENTGLTITSLFAVLQAMGFTYNKRSPTARQRWAQAGDIAASFPSFQRIPLPRRGRGRSTTFRTNFS
ncbi:hypothetical protein [Magnetospira sp. QH-2]|uniref:hypothetical protein n=1 Tax=Magnetospira sp. (strain QH-2) TaxID=1288970 RepID=UPI0003E818D4|nr:hypothetical protein [Magnetospira sp. QH-2]CCQ73920.1 protein of unknown function [Magnetospira sp. QH-2]